MGVWDDSLRAVRDVFSLTDETTSEELAKTPDQDFFPTFWSVFLDFGFNWRHLGHRHHLSLSTLSSLNGNYLIRSIRRSLSKLEILSNRGEFFC